jgi:hypothetical protein
MQRYEIINHLIKHFGYKSYLEIGVSVGTTWNVIECERKVGVDPDRLVDDERIHCLTSDDYFKNNHNAKFDIIFIDGLHLAEQAWRDIGNAIDCLNRNGTIVIHDCNPPTLKHAGIEPEIFRDDGHMVWCGTVWRAVMELNKYSPLDFMTIDTDWGCGIRTQLTITTRIKNQRKKSC